MQSLDIRSGAIKPETVGTYLVLLGRTSAPQNVPWGFVSPDVWWDIVAYEIGGWNSEPECGVVAWAELPSPVLTLLRVKEQQARDIMTEQLERPMRQIKKLAKGLLGHETKD